VKQALYTRVCLIGILIAVAFPVSAQEWTAWSAIRELEAGWSDDVVAVRVAAPMINPGGCARVNHFATSMEDAGHSLFHTMLMSAFLNRKEVALLINGCSYQQPRIIAVKLR
jgi:hypothetical protein